jgi:hypothetical protein
MPGNRDLLSRLAAGPGVPAVVLAGTLDELTDSDERGSEVQAEVHDPGVAIRADG